MKILMIADPHLSVPPANYGGTERMVDLMCRGLAQRGHVVRLLAGPGSQDYGGGVTVHRAPGPQLASRATRKLWFQWLSVKLARHCDVMINHGRLDYLEAIYRTQRPVIHWFHNPLTHHEVAYVRSRRREGDTFVGVSHAQVSGNGGNPQFAVVYNAIETETIRFSAQRELPPYVVFLGRLTPNKGVHVAIDAADRAGVKLVIGGNIPNELGCAEYFARSIQPRLGKHCEWVGPYDDATRVRLLSGASALLFPIQWDEPFGLVMLEALAGGVPVIASRRAATPEVVTHGETGFLCDSVDEMAEAIRRVNTISRARCRREVEERFGAVGFINQVEALLRRVVKR